jgi:hypothetical protein
VDSRVPRLWEQLLCCERQARGLAELDGDYDLAEAAALAGRALLAVWNHASRSGSAADRAVLCQLVGRGEARNNGDPPAPERAVPGPGEE